MTQDHRFIKIFSQDCEIFRDENGFSERANIIVDEKQRVLFIKIYPVLLGAGYRGDYRVFGEVMHIRGWQTNKKMMGYIFSD
jgi:hypothetical protein